MRAIFILGALLCPLYGWAQIIVGVSSFSSGTNGAYTISGSGSVTGAPALRKDRPESIGTIEAGLRMDPGISGPPGSISFNYSGRSTADVTYFTRTFTDSVNREVFGYEVLIEQQQQPGVYLATFTKLAMTPKLAADLGKDWREWSVRDVRVPEQKLVHDGDALNIGLISDPGSGFMLSDEITVRPNAPPAPILPRAAAPFLGNPLQLSGRGSAPTVSGPAREFSAADAEMQIHQPRVIANGDAQGLSAPATNINGSLIWLYLPGHGRYVLSLAPRPQLKFKPAGEVRGGTAKFAIAKDTITIECPQAIAPGHAAYTLYVLYDPLWEPTSSRQKGQSAMGSVDPGELEELERQ